MHYLCRTLSTFLFFDAILFSLSPPCPTAGICFVVSREKKITKNMKKICFSRETLLFLRQRRQRVSRCKSNV